MLTWLFRPFKILSGWLSVFLGLAIIALTSIIASFGNIHLDGILDLHVGAKTNMFFCFAEGLIDWLSLSILIFLSGIIFSKSKVALLNVFGMQALARFPYFVATLLTLLLFSEKIGNYLDHEFLGIGNEVQIGTLDIVAFVFLILCTLAILVWSVILMYRAYSMSCNLKGARGVLSFIVCFMLAEVLSKLLITALYYKIYS